MMKKMMPILIPFGEGMHFFGERIAFIVNSTLLFLVYVVAIGITSVIAKLFGKHFLDTAIDPKRETYWQDLPIEDHKESIYRQF